MCFKKFFKTKTIESLQAEAKKEHSLERTLGPLQLVLLGIGAIIGAGIFVLTGPAAAEHAGPAVVISFAIGGLACACAALCYAELASMIPIAGSSYTYTYATLGELPAWLISGMIILTYALGAATVASGWSGYLQSFLKDYDIFLPVIFTDHTGALATLANGDKVTTLIDLPAVFIVLLLGYVVYRGAEASAIVNSIIVAVKMTVLVSFILIGVFYINPENWVPFIPENTGEFGKFGYSGIIAASAIVFLAFTGFDAVATAAQETKNPKRDLPIGIIGSLVICVVFYMLVSGVLTGIAPYQSLNVAEPMAVAADVMGMPWFATVVKIGALIGLTSVILVLIFSVVRVLYSVTHDGLLPDFLAITHKKYHTPHVITAIVITVITIMASVLPLNSLVKLANFGTLVTFAVVCFATLLLHYTQPKLKREFKCPLMPWVPLTGMIVFGVILMGLEIEIFMYASVWIAFLILVYLTYGFRNSHLHHPHKLAAKRASGRLK